MGLSSYQIGVFGGSNLMDLMLAFTIGGFILAFVSLVLVLYVVRNYRSDFKGITQLSSALEESFKDEDASELIYDSIDAFHNLGALSQNINAIITDEETFDALMTDFAGRVRSSIMHSMMGTASGDVKKKARAERLLNDALVDGAQQLNPMLGMLLRVTGLDEELKADPELLGYILQIVNERGLLNMFDQSMLSLPSSEQEAKVKQHLGIDF